MSVSQVAIGLVCFGLALSALLGGCGEQPAPGTERPAVTDAEPVADRVTTSTEPAAHAASPPAEAVSTPRPLSIENGRATYNDYCAHCHDSGDGRPGTMRLGIRIDPDHAVLLSRTDLAPAYVTQIVRYGIGMMPPFRPTEISDDELANLAAYVGQNFDLN